MLDTAVQHAVSVHGHEETPEMRDQLREFLEPEANFSPGAREQEPMPG